jgi:hypothetical protein
VGVLAHFLEREGIPTTQISLIRVHTEKIRPPRALWVPFELGRPLGAPQHPEFQRRVLQTVLGLLDHQEGPILADFAQDAPRTESGPEVLACPYVPPADPVNPDDSGESTQLKEEIAALKPWYRQVRGDEYRPERSLSKRTLEEIADRLGDVLSGNADSKDFPLRYGVEDLKAFYFTALAAQPGLHALSGDEVEQWFWKETTAGRMLRRVQRRCRESDQPTLNKISAQVIPNRYLKELEM